MPSARWAESQQPQRLSPVHEQLEKLAPRWGLLCDMPVAVEFDDALSESAVAGRLGLCDASALPRLTVKGSAAAGVLAEVGIPPPGEIYQHLPLPQGGVCIRTGSAEFFVEEGCGGGAVARLEQALRSGRPGAYYVPRQDVSLLLSGGEATAVLSQACSYDFGGAAQRDRWAGSAFGGWSHPTGEEGHQRAAPLVMTSVAGVGCSVLLRWFHEVSVYQLWADGTYGVYLWETLLEIVRELGGGAAGLAPFFPDAEFGPLPLNA